MTDIAVRASFRLSRLAVAASAVALLLGTGAARAVPTIDPTFASDYSISLLGSVPGLPANYGGLAFIGTDTIVIGGSANGSTGLLYTIDVVRDASLHITGFSGTATPFRGGTVGIYNDGGVAFGPDGVLFTTRYPTNQLGQTKPGSTVEDKVIDLTPLGVGSSVGAVNFVPVGFGFGGEGLIKLVSYNTGGWYSASLTPDGNGTFDLSGLAQVDLDAGTAGVQVLGGGPEGFVHVRAGNAQFSSNSLLVSEYVGGAVAAYQVDANGDPLLNTRRTFVTGLSGAEGAVVDPFTGDFLFSTFGGGNQVVLVSGFSAAVPEPATWLSLLGGLGLLGALARRRQPAPA